MANDQPAGSAGATADPLWRLRWWLLAAGLVVLAALVLLKFELSLTFRLSLFVGGLIVGVCGAGWINWLTTRIIDLTNSRGQLERFRRRRLVYTGAWLLLGVELGLIAALFDLPWLLIVVAGYLVALIIGSLFILKRLKGRAAKG